jgi:osmotically inducible protein OsmC
MKPLYTAHATAKAGRNGHAETSDGLIKFDLSIPKEMGGPGKTGATNPEQLFALGYAACFGSAIEYIAGQQKKKIGEVSVTSHVTIGAVSDGFQLAVTLEVAIAGTAADEVQSLIDAAHQICPYSKATRGNVEVTLKAV